MILTNELNYSPDMAESAIGPATVLVFAAVVEATASGRVVTGELSILGVSTIALPSRVLTFSFASSTIADRGFVTATEPEDGTGTEKTPATAEMPGVTAVGVAGMSLLLLPLRKYSPKLIFFLIGLGAVIEVLVAAG
jgi:hypothetical protein